MATQNATGRSELEPWQVGDLRLTAFPAAAQEGKGWETLVGTPPEHSAEFAESGPVEPAAILTCRRSPSAIQWMLHPAGPETYFRMNAAVLTPFKALMTRWLADCPPLRRLAFGAALYLPVEDRPEAYRRLEDFLHLGLKYSDEEGDFLYQYNRRRGSLSVPEVKINRLSKWTWVPLGEVRAEDGRLVFPQESACLLELDINTAPEFPGILPHDRYIPLFEEMVGLAAEIAAKGDVP